MQRDATTVLFQLRSLAEAGAKRARKRTEKFVFKSIRIYARRNYYSVRLLSLCFVLHVLVDCFRSQLGDGFLHKAQRTNY